MVRKEFPSTPHRLLETCVAGLVGSVLLIGTYAAVRASLADFLSVSRYRIIEDIRQGKTVSQVELETLSRSLERSARLFPDDETFRDLTYLGLYLAANANVLDEGARREFLLAERHAIESLRLSPGNPYSWLHLAVARHYLGAPPAQVSIAVEASEAAGPWQPELLLSRLELVLLHWDNVDADLRKRSFMAAWRHNRRATFELATEYSRAFDLGQLLASDAGEVGRFIRFMQRTSG